MWLGSNLPTKEDDVAIVDCFSFYQKQQYKGTAQNISQSLKNGQFDLKNSVK